MASARGSYSPTVLALPAKTRGRIAGLRSKAMMLRLEARGWHLFSAVLASLLNKISKSSSTIGATSMCFITSEARCPERQLGESFVTPILRAELPLAVRDAMHARVEHHMDVCEDDGYLWGPRVGDTSGNAWRAALALLLAWECEDEARRRESDAEIAGGAANA